MNIVQERVELAAWRAEVVALFQQPDLTADDRQQLKALLIDLAKQERELKGFVRLVQYGVQRFDEPKLLDYLTRED